MRKTILDMLIQKYKTRKAILADNLHNKKENDDYPYSFEIGAINEFLQDLNKIKERGLESRTTPALRSTQDKPAAPQICPTCLGSGDAVPKNYLGFRSEKACLSCGGIGQTS